MAVKIRLKKGDRVVITAGKDKGKTGDITRVIKGSKPGDHRVVVGGANMVKRHTKPTQMNPGGIVEREASVHASNVQIVCPECGVPTRLGRQLLGDGRKVRICRKCDGAVDK